MAEQSPSYGFSDSYEPSPQAKALGKVIEVLEDPRNSWMGLGPMSKALGAAMGMVKGPGWGAEALRRYKLIGGTSETLNTALKNRAMEPQTRRAVVSQFRQATDLATPDSYRFFPRGHNPQADLSFEHTLEGLGQQDKSMEVAGNIYRLQPRGGRPFVFQGEGPSQPTGKMTEELFRKWAGYAPPAAYESASSGNAAYGATSRQVGRMLDTPGFKFNKAEDLPALPEGDYSWAFPIKQDSTIPTGGVRGAISGRLSSTPAERRANVNLTPPYMGEERRVADGGLDRRVLQLLDDWQRDERTLTAEEMNILRQHYGNLPE